MNYGGLYFKVKVKFLTSFRTFEDDIDSLET